MVSASSDNRSPELSVVVPAVNGGGPLSECVAALDADRAAGPRVEIVVVDRCGATAHAAVRAVATATVDVPVPATTSIPEMRAIGIRHAHAPVVAVIEDHVLVPAGWAQRMLDAIADADVVGGAVANAAVDRMVDWGAFLSEYGHLLAGGRRSLGTLAGNNVAYRREVLEKYATTLAEGKWEDHFHAVLRRDGARLKCDQNIVVGHRMCRSLREHLAQRYWYSRSWAGLKGRELTAPRRVLAGTLRLVLPPVLLFRIVTSVLASGRHRAELVRSLPVIAALVCVWAAGEAVGYVAGPGDALVRVS